MDWQEVKTVLAPRLTVRLWEQPGGRERPGMISRTLTPAPGPTRQWQLVLAGRGPG